MSELTKDTTTTRIWGYRVMLEDRSIEVGYAPEGCPEGPAFIVDIYRDGKQTGKLQLSAWAADSLAAMLARVLLDHRAEGGDTNMDTLWTDK